MGNISKNKISVFLSYNRIDNDFVLGLYRRLKSLGIETWLDQASLVVGESIVQEVYEKIPQMDYFVAIVSENSIRSNWPQQEWKHAIAKENSFSKPRVLPIILGNESIPDIFGDKQYIRFRDSKLVPHLLSKLLRGLGIDGGLKGTSTEAHERSIGRCRGLTVDLPNFRTGEIIQAIDLLSIQQAINQIECLTHTTPTTFRQFRHGDRIKSEYLNQMFTSLKKQFLVLNEEWEFKNFPVEKGQKATVELMNELPIACHFLVNKLEGFA